VEAVEENFVENIVIGISMVFFRIAFMPRLVQYFLIILFLLSCLKC